MGDAPLTASVRGRGAVVQSEDRTWERRIAATCNGRFDRAVDVSCVAATAGDPFVEEGSPEEAYANCRHITGDVRPQVFAEVDAFVDHWTAEGMPTFDFFRAHPVYDDGLVTNPPVPFAWTDPAVVPTEVEQNFLSCSVRFVDPDIIGQTLSIVQMRAILFGDLSQPLPEDALSGVPDP